jgi:hypothetical protein
MAAKIELPTAAHLATSPPSPSSQKGAWQPPSASGQHLPCPDAVSCEDSNFSPAAVNSAIAAFIYRFTGSDDPLGSLSLYSSGTPVRCKTHGPFLLCRRPPELPCHASLSAAPVAFRRHPCRQRTSMSPDSPVHAQRIVPSSLVPGEKSPLHLSHRLTVLALGTVTAQSAHRACRANLGWPSHFGYGLGHPQ